MAKVFLDANTLIDLIERKESLINNLSSHLLFISPLSLHILSYVYKYRCPSSVLKAATEKFSLVSLDLPLTQRAAQGPTSDLEDNIQLQSACFADCDFFLTSDQSLLRMRFFGKTQIASRIT